MMQWRLTCLMSYNFHVWFFQFQTLLQSANIVDSNMAIPVSSEFISQLFTSCNLRAFAGYLISRCVLLTYGLVRGPISNLQVACVSCGVQPCCSVLILMRLWRFVDALTVVCYSPFDTGARCNCDNSLYNVLWSHKLFGGYTSLDRLMLFHAALNDGSDHLNSIIVRALAICRDYSSADMSWKAISWLLVYQFRLLISSPLMCIQPRACT